MSISTRFFSVALVCAALVCHQPATDAFITQSTPPIHSTTTTALLQQRLALHVTAATQENEEDLVLYSEEDDEMAPLKRNARWNSLSPKVKLRIMNEAHERAIANKKKREPSNDKKRRMMMHFKKAQVTKKRASRVQRPVAFTNRTLLLSELEPNASMNGTVISLVNFGAYVDVGSECDGLLHVSQMTRDFFVEHPRQVLSPGDCVTVTVRSVNPEKKKLHLTMLPREYWESNNENDEERIPLDEIDVDDELWGEIKRVTDYGCYVELGAQVDGFLHFMDHPLFGTNNGGPPSEFMNTGDRIRVWVADVDMDKKRIKLTAIRPTHLPGPRRDIY
mmetsp:Transcript_23980/g.43471  ORF Transcript_23980/g.43471 Transcript_23980/m.43471 type:complete len:334 (-) Transcript_23980:39-1040(-)